jgi:hypothetical protein
MTHAPATDVSPQRAALIARRWLAWKPWALRETARIVADGAAQRTVLESHRIRHRENVLTCLRAGIKWRVITRERLDDPRMTDIRREQLIAQHAERHLRQVSAQAHRRTSQLNRKGDADADKP